MSKPHFARCSATRRRSTRSTVSRICQQVKDEFAAFATMDLSKLRIDYLFLDGTNFRFHEHSPGRCRCFVPGASTPTESRISSDSLRPARSRLTPGPTFSKTSSRASSPRPFSSSPTVRRGSSPPSSRSFRRRFAKDVSSTDSAMQSPRSPRPTRTPSRPTGGRSSTRSRNHPVSKQSPKPAGASTASGPSRRHAYPGAVACLVEDFESLSVHLRFPKEHWKRCRHTNLHRAHLRRDSAQDQGDRAAPRRARPVSPSCTRCSTANATAPPRDDDDAVVRSDACRSLRRELLGEQQDPVSEDTVTAAAE